MLQVKIKFRLNFFNLGWFSIFLSLLALIIHEETNEAENQSRLKNSNLNVILTCNIYTVVSQLVKKTAGQHDPEMNLA